ncbi:hypothetical protein HL653_10420 [Sphingomonas sp. AP4-R1]|uniref:VOC family protein n=1 Tax=Sphingomonas sp. AP4-R1 TaxID=2735134 RepID=UPI0014935461|nr:VOC family protein [Sphingomonas sp. AP4-R1]QJU58155.1 hypothetical protein HL653_10420 [Sphingomonas sp. AP4-R1]
MQIAFAVKDLDETLRFWTEVMKVGPFVVIDNSVAGRRVVYRGEETGMDSSLAFSYVGDVQIEIVHQTNDEPSPFKDFLDSGREGLQHIAFWPADFEGACSQLEQLGFREILSMYTDDGARNVVYYEAPPHVGVMVEIVPWTASRQAYFSRIQNLTRNWDGTRPVRRFASREEFLATGEGTE